jgi:hypothetical protein
MDGMIAKGWEKTWITKAFTLDFQVEAMEVNALTLLFTFTLEVEEYNDEEDNKTNPIDSIVVVIENCLQVSFTPLGVAITSGCASTSSNVKISGLKQQVRLKEKKLGHVENILIFQNRSHTNFVVYDVFTSSNCNNFG